MVTCYFLLFLLFIAANSVEAEAGVKFQLIRRRDLLGVERLRRLARSDAARARGISRRVGAIRRRRIRENAAYEPACRGGDEERASGELPMRSGADYGVGQYLVKLRVGSPSQKVVLIADTGSDLTWSNCRYKCGGGGCGGGGKRRRVFRADRSSSFRTVPCSSAVCKTDLANLFSLSSCPSPLDPCSYDYRYSDGSATVGVFGNESVTLRLSNGRKARLRGVLVGCSESARGPSFSAADGVMGLGYSNYSVAVKAAHRFGGKFSYCLVDHLSPKNLSSYLIFGSNKGVVNISAAGGMRYTELVLGVINPFYAVNVRGVSVGGVMLDIPAEVWDLKGAGGAIVDSGTSLTVLTRPAYKPVVAALRRALLGFERLRSDAGPLDYCFNSTGFDAAAVPRLGLHFADGARFEPPVKSYVIDAAPGVKCLGFAEAAWPGASVVGNILQQNHLWEFDIGKGRLGFATSSCV